MKKILTTIGVSLMAFIMLFATACSPKEPTPTPPDGSTEIKHEGEIVVSLPTGTAGEAEVEAYQAVADAYMAKYPDVLVTIDSRPASIYQEFLNGVLAVDTEQAYPDIVQTILADRNYLRSGKFVDYSPYLVKENPYYDNEVWMNTMDVSAYAPKNSGDGYTSLSFNSTMGLFYYNEEIFKRAGLTDTGDYYGNPVAPKDWDEFVTYCEKIAATTNPDTGAKYIPFVIDGSYSSYDVTFMSWLTNTYADQYFRDAAVDLHAQENDYCYDAEIDGVWEYKPNVSDYPELDEEEAFSSAVNNDSSTSYNYNPVRFYKMIQDGTMGTDNARYQDLLANLTRVIPKYCQPEFTSKNLYEAQAYFFSGEAAMTFDTTQFFDTFKVNVGPVEGNGKIDLNWFLAPPMKDNPDVEGGAPAVDYTRSIGGSHGYYGVINKNKEHNDLVVDYLMFWSSLEGQEVYMEKIREQGRYLSGHIMINGVQVDSSIYPAADITFPGTCQNLPVANSFGTLLGSTNVNASQAYRAACKELFENRVSIEDFCKNVQNIMQTSLPGFIESLGYRDDALLHPELNPYA